MIVHFERIWATNEPILSIYSQSLFTVDQLIVGWRADTQLFSRSNRPFEQRLVKAWVLGRTSKLQVANKGREVNKEISNENWMFQESELSVLRDQLVAVAVAAKQKLQSEVSRGTQTFPVRQFKDLELEIKTPLWERKRNWSETKKWKRRFWWRKKMMIREKWAKQKAVSLEIQLESCPNDSITILAGNSNYRKFKPCLNKWKISFSLSLFPKCALFCWNFTPF